MDGVLCNFDKKFEEITEIRPELFVQLYPKEMLFTVIDDYGTFWKELDWMPDGEELWDTVENFEPIILTTPGGNIKSCKKQKKEWVKRHIGLVPIKFSFHKYKYATPESVLIDDMDKNLIPWEKAGGIAIKHISTANTITHLQEVLRDIIRPKKVT